MWNPECESLPREDLNKLQGQRLRQITEYAYNKLPYFQRKCKQAGVTPEDIQGLDDLKRLPFTAKQDLRDAYPFGVFAVPTEDVVRIHASSGTTGKPTVGGYTRKDLETWGEVMARTVTAAGVTSVFSPAVWGFISALKRSGRPRYPFPAGRRGARSCSWKISAPPCSPARLPIPWYWRKRQEIWESISKTG
jgi:hypothetical protein